jgi:nitrogenase molybdenum-cofactor synthesis protein NifE
MSKLCISLPPFAPDYSGAASALFDMGGLIVIHDASGCTGNYTGFDEPRWFGSKSAVFCSGLRHMDAVLGNDAKLIRHIEDAAASLKPRFIAVLGSPVPMVIGTDFGGIANEIEFDTGIPSIGLATRGLAYYGTGICAASEAMLKKFVKEEKSVIPGSVNLLGITPLDFYINGNSEDFRALFESNGIPVIASYHMGMSVEDLNLSLAASLNVAVSQAGVQLAEYMKKNYGMPYIAVTPLGDGSIALEKVRSALYGEYLRYTPVPGDSDTLIVGEQIIAVSIREYLQKECAYGPVTNAVLYDVSENYMAAGDIKIRDESELRRILNSGKYKTVIGDPMLKKLIKSENAGELHFCSLPHVALSSKVHWDEYKKFLSRDMTAWLNNVKREE